MRLKPSDPRYQLINSLQLAHCYMTNPTVHFNINTVYEETPELEWRVGKTVILDQLDEVLKGELPNNLVN